MIVSQESKRTALGITVLLALGLSAAPCVASRIAAQSTVHATPAEVRALGRVERPDLVPVLLPFLSSSSAEVRTEAANALAQALHPLTSDSPGTSADSLVRRVAAALRSRLAFERDPSVQASIAQALGRLPYRDDAGRARVKRLLVNRITTTSDATVAAGAARGVLALVRGERTHGSPDPALAPLLAIAADSGGVGVPRSWSDTTFAWPRRLVMLTLLAGASATSGVLDAASRSADSQLRMLAARGLGTSSDSMLAARRLRELARDQSSMVRTEVAQAWSRDGRHDCAGLLPLSTDSAPQTSVTAIDAMGSACGGLAGAEAERALERLVRTGTVGSEGALSGAEARRVAMHRAAHAIVALARLAPPRATALLPAVAASPAWQARMYAARAAAIVADTSTLRSLSSDAVPNVRTEAVIGLSGVMAHAADDAYVDALSSSDYQLVREAARALEGSPQRADAVHALVRSLARITAEKRENSRDPRVAILHTVHDLGSADLAETLLPYLADFDPVVADSAAAMVSEWTGRAYRSSPRPLPSVDAPLPDLAELASRRVRITMAASAGGGSFDLRLFPDDAPLTVSRFVRLVRSGYYDGLTIHRVVPNFVVQGGSPGANEYVGDGPFLRDEVGLRSHRRGAVGISTRGRNTGDAQIFVDLVDLPRLDHEYTVFADVVSGMAVVDGILEGDVMESVRLLDD